MKAEIAVIDIGSNSVRLMLAGREDGRVRSISKTLCTTRLAKGIDGTNRLAPDRVADTVEAIRVFHQRAAELGIPSIAYATSAVRDAQNRDAFVALVKEQTGMTVRVLSGREEGAYAFDAATGGEGTVFDIGGGSFQIVTKDRSLSFPCGCVRAKEHCDASEPEELERSLFAWMDGKTDVPGCVPGPVYGVGGTITTIGAMLASQKQFDPDHLERITLPKLDGLLKLLSLVPEPTRMQMPLLKRRGDVILQGATILRYLMIRTNTDCVIPADRDGMEGIAEAYFRSKSRIADKGGNADAQS